jgi:hypothetical protein
MRPILAASTLTAILSACAAPPPPPPPPPKPTLDVVDGLYRGTSTRFAAIGRQCPRPGLVSFQVWDRKFQYRWSYNVYVDGEILEDGVIQGQGPGITMVGRYTPKKIVGDVTNGDCGLHFTVTLRDN